MRGFFWGILFTAAALVGLMWTGILNIRYTSSPSAIAAESGTAYASNSPTPSNSTLPEIRVLDRNEGR